MINGPLFPKRYNVRYNNRRDAFIDEVWRCQICNTPLMLGKQYTIICTNYYHPHGEGYTCLSKRCIEMRILQLI